MACGAAALRGDPAGHFERPQRAAAVVDDDRRALGREPLGDGAPDPARAARDERRLPFE